MGVDIHQVLRDAAWAINSVQWNEVLDFDYGACIPIAVFGVAFIEASGIQARVVECWARFEDPLSVRYAEIGTSEPGLEAQDEKGLPFFGHCAIQLPTHRMVVDFSLPTQGTITLRNLGAVHILIGRMDHTKGEVGFVTPLGRGRAIYRVYPKRDGWSKRAWPFDEIRTAAVEARMARGDFAFLKDFV